MRLQFIFAVATVAFASCGERQTGTFEPTDPREQHGYFPLEIGKYVEYAVDSVVFDFAPGGSTFRDTTRVLVREVVADTLRDNAGNLIFKIERFERSSAAENWVVKNVWSASRSDHEAIRTEENLRFQRLIFPLDRRSEWDGNAFIEADREIEIAGERVRPFQNWLYEVDSLDVPGAVGNFAFDSLLVVSEVDTRNVIERRFSRVKYAKNVGLVWREQWILDSQYCNQTPPPPDCEIKPWEEKAEKGYILRQWVIGHN